MPIRMPEISACRRAEHADHRPERRGGGQARPSGPALYYYASHDELVDAVTASFFSELAEAMITVRDARADASLGERVLATCRAIPSWATTHPAEFEWVFASPIAGPNRTTDSARYQAGQRFEQVFLDPLVELWETKPTRG